MKLNQIHNTFRQGLSDIMRPTRQLFAGMAFLGMALGGQEAKANNNNGTAMKSRAQTARSDAANSYMIYNYGEQYRPGKNLRVDSIIGTVKTADNLYVAMNKVLGEPLTPRDAYVRLVTSDAEQKANIFKNAYGNVRQQLVNTNKGTSAEDIQLIDPLKRIDISDTFRIKRLHPKLGVIRDHNGTDLRVSSLQGVGTAVYAVGDLQFTETGTDRSGVSYAKFILLQGGQSTGYGVEYLHVKKIDKKKCPPGTIIKQGEMVTSVGPTDAVSTGPHLEYRVTHLDMNTNKRTGFVNSTSVLKNGNVLKSKGLSKPSPVLEKVPTYVMDYVRQDQDGSKFALLEKTITADYKAGQINEKTYQERLGGAKEVDYMIKRDAYTTWTANRDIHIKMASQSMDMYRHVGSSFHASAAETMLKPVGPRKGFASIEAIYPALQENRTDLQQSGDLYAAAQTNELPLDKGMPTQAYVFTVDKMRENKQQVVARPTFTATASSYAPVFTTA